MLIKFPRNILKHTNYLLIIITKYRILFELEIFVEIIIQGKRLKRNKKVWRNTFMKSQYVGVFVYSTYSFKPTIYSSAINPFKFSISTS